MRDLHPYSLDSDARDAADDGRGDPTAVTIAIDDIGDGAVDSDGDNRRRQQRFTVQLTSVLVGGNADPEHSMLVNLSAGGVYVRTANPPPIGAQVGIEFTLLGKRTCSAAGQVVWRAETGRRAGFGIEFDHANDNMQRFIASLGRLPTHLRPIYLADVTLPQIETP